MNHFKIITPTYNSARWIEKCILSVKNQTYIDYQQIIIDDNSTDDTIKTVEKVIAKDNRFVLIKNKERVGVPLNHKKGIEISSAKSENIIVHLDGDDWFYDSLTLDKVNEIYEKEDCWLTYGSYVTTNGDLGIAKECTINPRDAAIRGWPFSHLRTFRRHVWDHLTDSDFIDSHGNPYRVAADVVILVPILERIGYSRVKFVETILMVYNELRSDSEFNTNLKLQQATVLDIVNK